MARRQSGTLSDASKPQCVSTQLLSGMLKRPPDTKGSVQEGREGEAVESDSAHLQ